MMSEEQPLPDDFKNIEKVKDNMTQNIDLGSLFQSVTQALVENQDVLNQSDEYNQDHGTNMVQTFETITRAVQAKEGQPASTALAYASKQVSKGTSSGSGQLYAQNLAQAANEFEGKEMDTRGAMQLLQTLIGSTQSSQQPSQTEGGDLLSTLLGGGGAANEQTSQAGAGDLLSSLLGGAAESSQTSSQQPGQSGGDLLGSLLGGLLGGEAGAANNSSSSSQGLDIGDLLNAGMAFMQSQQSGKSTLESLVQAFCAGSGMGNTSHRNQSTAVVVNAFLQALGVLKNK
jgi:hypothetical protein